MSDSDRVETNNVPGMFAASLTGERERDEDFVVCGEFGNVRVGVLCDGMGGAEDGELASQGAGMAFVEGVGSIVSKGTEEWGSQEFRPGAYAELLLECHATVNSVAGEQGRSGTTLTALVITFSEGTPTHADLVHMGDSRCYRVAEGRAEIITQDHSVTGDMLRAGYIKLHEIPETAGNNALTRSLGDEVASLADISTLGISPGDSFLLCCDGVWGPLHTEAGLWLPDSPLGQQATVEALVNEALERGSTDNCSALSIDLGA